MLGNANNDTTKKYDKKDVSEKISDDISMMIAK